MGYKYTVIIPHYNIPDLLVRCLDSIPLREDIKVIVVDDLSPGGENYLERYPQLSRPHLTYIRAPRNGGAGWARNLALPHAEGTWLVFADADDCFSEDAFDTMDRYTDSDADIIYFHTEERVEGDWHPALHYGWLYDAFKTTEETGNDRALRKTHLPPWGKMLRLSFVQESGAVFNETRHSEDVVFSVRTGYLAKKVIIAPEVIYYTYIRQGSNTNLKYMPLATQVDKTKMAILVNGLYRQYYQESYYYAYITLKELYSRNFIVFCWLLPFAKRNKISYVRLWHWIKGKP